MSETIKVTVEVVGGPADGEGSRQGLVVVAAAISDVARSGPPPIPRGTP